MSENRAKSKTKRTKRRGPGRPPGSKNKRTSKVKELLDSMDCNPVEQLALLANDTDRPELRLECLKALLPYYAPRLQATTIDLKALVEHRAVIALPGDSEWDSLPGKPIKSLPS